MKTADELLAQVAEKSEDILVLRQLTMDLGECIHDLRVENADLRAGIAELEKMNEINLNIIDTMNSERDSDWSAGMCTDCDYVLECAGPEVCRLIDEEDDGEFEEEDPCEK